MKWNADAHATGLAGGSAGGTERRKRRRVVYVSEVDQHLLSQGLQPSWDDKVAVSDLRPGSFMDSPDIGDGANDQRLLDNIPPHSQARA